MPAACIDCQSPKVCRTGPRCIDCWEKAGRPSGPSGGKAALLEQPPLTPEQYAEALPWVASNPAFPTSDPVRRHLQELLRKRPKEFHGLLERWVKSAPPAEPGPPPVGTGSSEPTATVSWDGKGPCPTCVHRHLRDEGTAESLAAADKWLREHAGG